MVTGEPGSGKTSLGLALAGALRVPFVSRDHVRGGLLATAGLWGGALVGATRPPREVAVDAFVEILEVAAGRGVTVVAEFLVTPQRVEAMRRLEAAFDCVVLLTSADDARARADRRDRNDPLLNRPEVLDALGYRSIDEYVAAPERERVRLEMQIDVALPLLRVATDEGYEPALDGIVGWVIEQQTRR
jgi:hypothetical protein